MQRAVATAGQTGKPARKRTGVHAGGRAAAAPEYHMENDAFPHLDNRSAGHTSEEGARCGGGGGGG